MVTEAKRHVVSRMVVPIDNIVSKNMNENKGLDVWSRDENTYSVTYGHTPMYTR